MKNKAVDARNYTFQSGEKILVDTNVWIYLYPPASRPAPIWAKYYSYAFRQMLSARVDIIIDPIILSEYINTYLRIEYKAYESTYGSFKPFRRSADGIGVLQSATAELTQILKITHHHDAVLAGVNLSDLLNEVQSGTIDFNDGLLVQNCILNGWKFLTNDRDMETGGIAVLTANNKLLQACP